MPHTITWYDRLRIERLVWSLDQQLYDLPRVQRIATRREVRANLLEAARDVGTREALRGVGGSRRLAEQFLTAEFGDNPRHTWIGAAYAAALTPLLLNFFLAEAANAFQSGVTATDPHATGVFTWSGVSWLQSAVTYTFNDGTATGHGGGWTPLAYLLWLVITVGFGRLWRLRLRRRPAVAPA
ncbi:hypothetical protein GCM10010435_50420 [Winogradskya consettensis]|uniref:Uncharacterized protein n=1 Tax=Winogradskya consettensis TaxID=113560 RepID=A0A919SZB5_9ACTN|nr:hypothetical protein [Actinoplanes consettensis]GIM80166.1 hypothetical protein Aco04nite_69320 [Actinoplanes consettensis]